MMKKTGNSCGLLKFDSRLIPNPYRNAPAAPGQDPNLSPLVRKRYAAKKFRERQPIIHSWNEVPTSKPITRQTQ